MKEFPVTPISCLRQSILLMALCIVSAAFAQQQDDPSILSNRTIYNADYFEQYNVVTARDQLNLIPGIQGITGGGGNRGGGGGGGGGGQQNQRGFGNAGDQILINGKRISGKSNDVGSVLNRIQARQVIRIEVIHGMEAGLDVRSQGPIVNLVLDDEFSTGYGAWQTELRHNSSGKEQYGFGLNYASTVGDLNYLISLEASPRANGQERSDNFYDALNNPTERRTESSLQETDNYNLISNTEYRFENGDSLNFNALFSKSDQFENVFSKRFRLNGVTEYFLRDNVIESGDDNTNWEIGGDYSRDQSNGNQIKVLFVVNESTSDSFRKFINLPSAAPSVVDNIQTGTRTYAEKILRGTYNWGSTDTSSFESGLETAVNSLDRGIRLFRNESGALQEVVLFNQSSTVSEKRIEGFTSYSRQLRSDVFLESSLDLEFSEITQKGGDVSSSRDFFFAKPRAALRHDLSDSAQLRGKIERTVSQLDFGDFVAAFSNDDNRSGVISAGNPGLEPEKAWEYELSYEHRFADNLGRVTVTGLYRDVEDHLAAIPLLITDASGKAEIRTAPGNIGDGRETRLSLAGSLRLGWLNLDRVLIEGRVSVTDTSVTDPFTKETRAFDQRADHQWNLGFRHDTTWKGLSYGVTASRNGLRYNTDLDYTQKMTQDPDLELFAELQPISGISVRLQVQNTLRATRQRERLQFIGNRADGILNRKEERISNPIQTVAISVRGTF